MARVNRDEPSGEEPEVLFAAGNRLPLRSSGIWHASIAMSRQAKSHKILFAAGNKLPLRSSGIWHASIAMSRQAKSHKILFAAGNKLPLRSSGIWHASIAMSRQAKSHKILFAAGNRLPLRSSGIWHASIAMSRQAKSHKILFAAGNRLPLRSSGIWHASIAMSRQAKSQKYCLARATGCRCEAPARPRPPRASRRFAAAFGTRQLHVCCAERERVRCRLRAAGSDVADLATMGLMARQLQPALDMPRIAYVFCALACLALQGCSLLYGPDDALSDCFDDACDNESGAPDAPSCVGPACFAAATGGCPAPTCDGLTCGVAVNACGESIDCNNGVVDGGETDVDCGGGCDACLDAMSCAANDDCMSGECIGGTCGTWFSADTTDTTSARTYAVAFDDAGHLYDLGVARYGIATAWRAFVNKRARDGALLKTVWLDIGGSDVPTDHFDITVSDGEVVAVGIFRSSFTLGAHEVLRGDAYPDDPDTPDADMFVARFDADLNVIAAAGYGAAGDQLPESVTMHPESGEVIIAGSSDGMLDFGGGKIVDSAIGDRNMFVVRMRKDGQVNCSNEWGATSAQRATGVDFLDPAALENNGGGHADAVVVGHSRDSITFGNQEYISLSGPDAFVFTIDDQCVAERHYQLKGHQTQHCRGVAALRGGDFVVVGNFSSYLAVNEEVSMESAGAKDGFVIRFDQHMTPLWWTAFGNAHEQSVRDVAVGPHNDINVGGGFNGTLIIDGVTLVNGNGADAGQQMMELRFAPDGTLLNAAGYGSVNSDQLITDIAVGPFGNVGIAGHFAASVAFPVSEAPHYAPNENRHGIVAKLPREGHISASEM